MFDTLWRMYRQVAIFAIVVYTAFTQVHPYRSSRMTLILTALDMIGKYGIRSDRTLDILRVRIREMFVHDDLGMSMEDFYVSRLSRWRQIFDATRIPVENVAMKYNCDVQSAIVKLVKKCDFRNPDAIPNPSLAFGHMWHIAHAAAWGCKNDASVAKTGMRSFFCM